MHEDDKDDPTGTCKQCTGLRCSSITTMPCKKSLTNVSAASSQCSSSATLGIHLGSSHRGNGSSPMDDDDMTESSDMLDELHARWQHQSKSMSNSSQASHHHSSTSKCHGSNDSDWGLRTQNVPVPWHSIAIYTIFGTRKPSNLSSLLCQVTHKTTTVQQMTAITAIIDDANDTFMNKIMKICHNTTDDKVLL